MQRAPQIRKLWRHNSVTLEKIFTLLLEVSIFLNIFGEHELGIILKWFCNFLTVNKKKDI